MNEDTIAELLHKHHYVPFKMGIGDPGDYCECGEIAADCEELREKLRIWPDM